MTKKDGGDDTFCDYSFIYSLPVCGVVIDREQDLHPFKVAPDNPLDLLWYIYGITPLLTRSAGGAQIHKR